MYRQVVARRVPRQPAWPPTDLGSLDAPPAHSGPEASAYAAPWHHPALSRGSTSQRCLCRQTYRPRPAVATLPHSPHRADMLGKRPLNQHGTASPCDPVRRVPSGRGLRGRRPLAATSVARRPPERRKRENKKMRNGLARGQQELAIEMPKSAPRYPAGYPNLHPSNPTFLTTFHRAAGHGGPSTGPPPRHRGCYSGPSPRTWRATHPTAVTVLVRRPRRTYATAHDHGIRMTPHNGRDGT